MTEEDITKSFEYLEDNLMGSYGGSKKIIGQNNPAEVYFYSPDKKLFQSQLNQFETLLKNKNAIKSELELELNRLLKIENHKHLDTLVSKPLEFRIISVLHDHKDHENISREHDIELIASKTYRSFFVKRGVDIVALISDGKIIEMIRP